MSDPINGSKKAATPTSSMLVARKQIEDAKERGDIRGWFVLPAKLPRGRPKKSPLHEETDEDDGQRAKRGAVLSFEEPSLKRERGMYDKWRRDPDMFALLKAAVINASRTGKNYCTPALLIHIPRTTMGRHKAAFEAAAKQHSIPLGDVTCQMVFPMAECGGGRAPLLTADDCKFLTDIAISRDLWNNGMTRSEIITMVMELSQCGSRQQAKNHYDHLVRKGKLEKFDEIKEHFFCNMDESSLLGSDGTVRVIGTASKSKTEKIMEDCRASITVLRTGAAGGFSGPWIFLAVGKEKITCRALRSIDTMPDVPPNSKVYMTPSAYMTDSVYAEIVPQLADSIRRMPHICNHPEWWVIVSLDGFGSHVNVHEAQAAFFERKIMILKEEGDTSHLKSGVRPVCGKERQGRDANEP